MMCGATIDREGICLIGMAVRGLGEAFTEGFVWVG